MKLCFSTLGCPDWKWPDVFSVVKDFGFPGIELRGIGDEIYIPRAKPFCGQLKETAAQIKAAGLEVPMISTGISLAVDSREDIGEQMEAYLHVAKALECPYLRVMITAKPQPEIEIEADTIVKRYQWVCDMAKPFGISPLMETNANFSDTALLAQMIQLVNRSNSGVLWDIHHPIRYGLESPAKTLMNLRGLIKHVHVKDSVMENGKTIYRMMGYGDIPVLECLHGLKKLQYEGYISLEWVKRWNPDLEEPGVVFAHYKNYMDMLFRQIK